jgi:hypothetical protein
VIRMMLRCETSEKRGPVSDIIRPGPGEAKKKRRWCGGSHSGGSPAVTEVGRPVVPGLGNLVLVTRGFRSFFGNLRQTRAKCGGYR